MNRSLKFWSSLSLLAYLGGCATLPYEPYAREVKRKPQSGGVIALHADHRSEDRAKADIMMKGNCGGSEVKVTEEGEIVVGEKVDSSAQKTHDTVHQNAFTLGGIQFGSDKPAENTAVQSTTTQLKEWQISYECVAQSMPAIAPTAKKKSKKSNKG